MHTHLRHKISNYLADVKARNPNFSLRSLAKQVGVNHSALSELINGKRRVSQQRATEIASRIGLSPNDLQRVSAEASPAVKGRGVSERKATALSLDKFETISGWLPFALISLMETEDFQSDIDWISQRMGVPKKTISTNLKRLRRLGMVGTDSEGRYFCTGLSFATPEFVASQAMRLHHLQNLDLARFALDNVPIDYRYFSSMTMAIDPARLLEAKRSLQQFRDEFCLAMEVPPKFEVYRLVLQLFPVSKSVKSRGEKC